MRPTPMQPDAHDHPMPDLTGTPYRVRRRLGGGTQGEVFEAEHVDTGRQVAVKLLHAHVCAYEWRAAAFCSEALASARIGSPHIVDVVDSASLEHGRPMIAMELLDGVTLREVMDQGPLAPQRVLHIARQICEGLRAAHDAGIVHLELSPSNVMLVERDGQSDFVVLLGFGATHLLTPRNTRKWGPTKATASEPSRGPKDARSDIYALGSLLYELVNGTPFDAPEPSATATRFSRRARERGLPRGVGTLVMRCLQRDPNARFQTMAELQAALHQLPEVSPKGRASGGWAHLRLLLWSIPNVVPATRS